MATSVVPDLIDALVAQTEAAAPDLFVLDGFGMPPSNADNTGDTSDFLMVGVEDPDDSGFTLSANTEEVPGPYATTRPRDETGEIVLTALSWNGDKDQKAARDAVYATAATVANLCRNDHNTPHLGVTGLLWTGYGSRSELSQNQTDQAAVAQLVFRISFRARI